MDISVCLAVSFSLVVSHCAIKVLLTAAHEFVGYRVTHSIDVFDQINELFDSNFSFRRLRLQRSSQFN